MENNNIDVDGVHGKDLEKIENLLEYLQKLYQLRYKRIYNINTSKAYKEIFWLDEIPRFKKYCFSRSWQEETEKSDGIWLSIKKYKEPIMPKIPDECHKWFDLETLKSSNDVPFIFPEVIDIKELQKENEDIDHSQEEPVVLKLQDHPKTEEKCKKYIEEKWKPWASLHRDWSKVQKIYGKLFLIHQEQQKLGEEYELVLGIGLLDWKDSYSHQIQRHLIVANVELIFESHLGKFTLMSAADGAKVHLELDMLDAKDQLSKARELEYIVSSTIEDNIWDHSSVDPLLESLANSIGIEGGGVYSSEEFIYKKVRTSDKPFVSFAPALILRKRSQRGLFVVLENIKKQLREGILPPADFLDMCEIDLFSDEQDILDEDVPKEIDPTIKKHDKLFDNIIYFTKPANNEQKKVIEKFNTGSGILVQGPPGTGKTHTIANLICHFLATGKRVLVTAKTERALQVLHDKLPDSIKPLCINLLGSGIDAQNSLKASVNGILAKQDDWNKREDIQLIENYKKQLHEIELEKQELNNRIRAVREKEITPHSICEGLYTGTVSKIALKLKEQSSIFSWFCDSVEYEQHIPFDNLENTIKDIYLYYKKVRENKTLRQYRIPNISQDVLDMDSLEKIFIQEADVYEKFKERQIVDDEVLEKNLNVLTYEQLEVLYDILSGLYVAVKNILRRPGGWIESAVIDMLSDQDTPWKDRHSLSEKYLMGLRSLAEKVHNIEISFPKDISCKKILNDAKKILEHFNSGGNKGFFIFKPRVVKDAQYILKNISIDGVVCDNSDSITILIDYISVHLALDSLKTLWKDKISISENNFLIEVGEYEELHEALTAVVSLYDLLEKAKDELSKYNMIHEPKWHDLEGMKYFCDVVEKIFYSIKADKANTYISHIKNNLTLNISQSNINPNMASLTDKSLHPVYEEMILAFDNRDIVKIKQCKQSIANLQKQKTEEKEIISSIKILNNYMPVLKKNLETNQFEFEKISFLNDALNWSKATSWINNFLKENTIDSLERQLVSLNISYFNVMEKLASSKAWNFCFNRMKDKHRRSLIGWQFAMNKYGKGTGKQASRFRRDAQRQLNNSKEAVPAWIMPLHNVYDTVDATTKAFDVVIVDEASQCGPEALPLLYIADKMLVVGDDEQISPEGIGVAADAVSQLQREYLKDFEHSGVFLPDASLFDHCKRRFNRGSIVLREHFRCMPEIIRFSNDLSYRDTPLIPLRQYPSDRLEPLKIHYVENGYREGVSSQMAINKAEADALVAQLVDCCKDPKYKDKTMGVIALQGKVGQVSYIQNQLFQQLDPEEIEKRRILCGDAYSFQGDERDVIFLSMLADSDHNTAVTKLADKRRYNVAVSRAKDQLWLFHSIMPQDLSNTCLRKQLLEHFFDPKTIINKSLDGDIDKLELLAKNAKRTCESPPEPFDSWFELDVALAIARKGYRVLPQYEFAGKRIDIVVDGIQEKLAIECDGDYWHGPEAYESDMERQRKLERCDWVFHRIKESAFIASKDVELESLCRKLKSMNIQPLKKIDCACDESIDDPLEISEQEIFIAEEIKEDYITTDDFSDEDIQSTYELKTSISNSLIDESKDKEDAIAKNDDSVILCERCNSDLKVLTGKYGHFFKCRKCNQTKSINSKTMELIIEDINCPTHNVVMIVKKGPKGYFMGCPTYPDCRHTKSIKIKNIYA